jgi:multiple sugar transport system ATP-binding protein
MDTMVFFTVDGIEVCGRVEPSAAKGPGETMQLRANLDHMHLVDPATNAVI